MVLIEPAVYNDKGEVVKKAEYNGCSIHRHTGDKECKAHRFCIGERLEERVPPKEGLPQPLPFEYKNRPLPHEENYLEVSIQASLHADADVE